MVETQIRLEEGQVAALRRLAAATGRRQRALMCAAVDRSIAERPGSTAWRATLDAMAGGRVDRDDLDRRIADSRRSAEERLERLWRSS